jgi:hypothetical protein
MSNLAINFAVYMASTVICIFSTFLLIFNVWYDNVLNLMFIELACVAVLSLLLATMLYGKLREF